MSDEEEKDELLPRPGEELPGTKNAVYRVDTLLGQGGYGAVFQVTRKSDGKKFAAKVETLNARKAVLGMDLAVLRGAAKIRSRHFCSVEDNMYLSNRCTYIVMKLLWKSLWDLRVERDPTRFTMNTALKAAEQSLNCLEQLHRIGFLHRDVKPGNFAVGRPETLEHHTVFLLDFGLCRRFVGDGGKDIRQQREVAPFRGTTRYAPLAAMREQEQSRKDDIEGWLYMVVEWTSGDLPWCNLNATNKVEVLKMKEDIRKPGRQQDHFFRHCPRREFRRILEYIDPLSYSSIPDYQYLLYCVQHAQKANNVDGRLPLDWDPRSPYTAPQEFIGDGVNGVPKMT